jgi:hypothetical protein
MYRISSGRYPTKGAGYEDNPYESESASPDLERLKSNVTNFVSFHLPRKVSKYIFSTETVYSCLLREGTTVTIEHVLPRIEQDFSLKI